MKKPGVGIVIALAAMFVFAGCKKKEEVSEGKSLIEQGAEIVADAKKKADAESGNVGNEAEKALDNLKKTAEEAEKEARRKAEEAAEEAKKAAAEILRSTADKVEKE